MLYRLLDIPGASELLHTPVRAALAAATAWLVCLAAGPVILRRLSRLNIREKTEKTPIEDEGLRRTIASKSGTPTMGGLILLTGLLAGCAAWADATSPLLLTVLACTVAMAALGVVDDHMKLRGKTHTQRGLKVRHKLLLQGLVGALLGLVLLRLNGRPLIALPHWWRGWALPVGLGWSALVLATMSNATNVTDGLDGLLTGLAPLVAVALGVASWAAGTPQAAAHLGMRHVQGAAELSVFCGALAGACLGFLRYNRHPARVFMGDTGSMAIGGGLAAVGLAAHQEFVLVLAGLVFLLEFGSSLLQIGCFQLLGRRVLPVAPVHHIFQQQGHPEPRIVQGFYLAGAAAALAGLGSIWL